MKRIEAVIRPHKADEVREALLEAGVKGMTALEVRGFGRQKGHKEIYRGSEYNVGFLPKVMIIVVVADKMLDAAVQIILKTAKTGEVGDGKIFVLDLESALRVRTGERDGDAL